MREPATQIATEQELIMLHHADNLKIRVDYFRPKHVALPSADVLRRAAELVSHRYALHMSLLGIAVVVTVAGALS